LWHKFSTAQIVTSDGIRLDMRQIKTPIVCFCSHGDNITPPQQALDWILDNYQSVEEIQQYGQRIFYNIDAKAGHLAIFVGTKVAEKNHAEFIDNGAHRRDAGALRDRDHQGQAPDKPGGR
jgi:homoserine acetyltransferase